MCIPGDVLVLATDGIQAVFADSLDISGSAQAITERILAAHRRPTDDALVVAVRYLGPRLMTAAGGQRRGPFSGGLRVRPGGLRPRPARATRSGWRTSSDGRR